MKVIHARNVEDALFTSLILFRDEGVVYPSRNGPMLELPTPVTTVYERPRERVVFDEVRDCNPFFHFFESIWMLAGHDTLWFLNKFTGNMGQFSDDGMTLNGAYGYRWRETFGFDQIPFLVSLLKSDPLTRRAVLSMWDARTDLTNQESKDLPCNTQVHFRLRNGKLDTTVLNRSNDAIWGAYGANAVHFSFLQEYIACSVGAEVGVYRQVSNSLHLYPGIPVAERMLAQAGASPVSVYAGSLETPLMLVPGESQSDLDHDIDLMTTLPDIASEHSFKTEFGRSVMLPMYRLWCERNTAPVGELEALLKSINSWDWRKACREWLNRRRDSKGLPLLR